MRFLMKQQDLSEFLNFKYYLLSSSREQEVFAPHAQYLDPDVFNQMIESAGILYKLVERLVREFLKNHLLLKELALPDFPFRQGILDLSNDLPPLFWVRYDAFERAGGGVFFSEFNYDKPCAQREIVISDYMNPSGNPNREFVNKFQQGINDLWNVYGNGPSKPSVGILVDPNHYDETHLAFLYADFLKAVGCECTILGGHNLKVSGDVVSAFGKPIDLILRQYPGEFSHEINDYSGLLDMIGRGKVLVLNDPRAIIPQAKSFFAYLWRLLDSHRLSEMEAKAVRETIPYTKIFSSSDREQVLSEQDKWVIKSVFGRYSECVYIGAMMTRQEWLEITDYVTQSAQAHVMQEFVPIKKRIVPYYNGNDYDERLAFGNYGIYFTCGVFSGTCVRWSTDYLSLDDVVWFTPVGVKKNDSPPYTIKKWQAGQAERRAIWEDIADKAAFQYFYTTSYTGEYESFSLEPMVVPAARYNELVSATEHLAKVFVKTRNLICDNYLMFSALLGLPPSLSSIMNYEKNGWLSFVSRFDWAVDKNGKLRLLEINTDTPAGLEAYGLNRLVKDIYPDYQDPNSLLPQVVREKFVQMTALYGADRIAVLGMSAMAGYEEDWAHIWQMGCFLQPLVQKVIYGDISALSCLDGRLMLNNEVIDAVYRYYPLDWLADEEHNHEMLTGLSRVLMINPPAALITQSKAFMAVVWQLIREGFYDSEEKKLIEKYLLPTSLEWQGRDCIIKPFLEREGKGVVFSKDLKRDEMAKISEQNIVYQEPVDIYPVNLTMHSTYAEYSLAAYPILGAFLIGDRFGGIYTRLGSRITDRYAVVAPTFIEE